MTKDDFDALCLRFQNSKLTPEEFYNQYVAENNAQDSFEDSVALISVLYELSNVDERIIKHIKENYMGV